MVDAYELRSFLGVVVTSSNTSLGVRLKIFSFRLFPLYCGEIIRFVWSSSTVRSDNGHMLFHNLHIGMP